MTHLEAYRKAGKMDKPGTVTDPADVAVERLRDRFNTPGSSADIIRQSYAPILAAAEEMAMAWDRSSKSLMPTGGVKKCYHELVAHEDINQAVHKFRELVPKEEIK